MPRHFQSTGPSKERLGAILKQSGVTLNEEQLAQLWRYHNLLHSRNQDRDLTRIVNFEAMVVKHYVDCLFPCKFLTLPSPIIDIGTGAGFPGIPIKIRYPHLRTILAEHRPNRIKFLKDVCLEIGLQRVEIFEHKVVSKSFFKPVQGVITRALEEIEKTCHRTSASLEKGGKLIFLKGPSVDAELKSALKRLGTAYRLIQDEHYFLPHTSHERRLIVLEKLSDRTAVPSE